MAYTASKLIAIAKAEVGYREKASNTSLDNPTANAGANNWTKFARDLAAAGYYNGNKNGYAWCDVFVDWCFYKLCGSKSKAENMQCQTGDCGAGCTFSMQYFQQQGRLDMNPKVGDQIFFRYSGSSGADHTGIVVSVSASQIVTIEGNSSDQVRQNTYSRSYGCIVGYGHPKYDAETAEEPEPVKPANTPVNGIDVSKWQGEIDWAKVKAAGVKFAMVRLGYGSADGTDCGVDGYFEKNVANAVKAGVDIGCYFYSYATSVAAAKKEAEFVTGVLGKYKGVFTYPVAFDIEDSSQQQLGKTVLTDMVIAFCDAIEKAGFYCSIYSNLNWLRNYLDDSRLTRFDHWLAQWADTPTYTGAFGMWQTSSTGSVNGISGAVDTDIAYKDYPAVIKGAKLNGFTGNTAPAVPAVPTAPGSQTGSITKGCVVKITGTKYYSGQAIPLWVLNEKWVVLSVSGDRVVINKSENGKYAIMSPVKLSDLSLVSGGASAPWVPAVGDTVIFKGTKHYTSANATDAKTCKGGKAKITAIYMLGTSKHPYHLIRESGGSATVYGWVDKNTFTKA